MDTLDKLQQYIGQEPSKNRFAWGIIHDSCNVILHHIEDKEIIVSDDFYEIMDKLTPESKIEDLAELFHAVRLNPVWSVWWDKDN